MKLTFLGAAENVTGSRYLLETNGTRILVDCGMYQERDLKHRNWDPFPVFPNSIAAVVLTHAHIDHCGYLPRLVRDGFKGPVYCTQVSAEIAKIVLEDSAKLQAEDAAFKLKRHNKEKRKGPYPVEPLYSLTDVQTTCSLLAPVKYGETTCLDDSTEVTFLEAGHILGSAIVKVKVRDGNQERTIVFSGDVGRRNRPILRDPVMCPPCDYLLIESTYGARLHEGTDNTAEQLAEVIKSTHERAGNIVIPSFAVERSHEILYFLNDLLRKDLIPHLPVFLDSPMAAKVVEVFKHHIEIVDEDMAILMRAHHSPFEFPELQITVTVEQSKAINHMKETAIIIAGSGMCTGGRIKHHLANNIAGEKSTILFAGYQAVGTLGRLIADGAKEVRLFGKQYPVRARVIQVHGFSAHADRNELLEWLAGFDGNKPRHTFVVHGEPDSARTFCDTLEREKGFSASVPRYGEEVALD